MVSRLGRSLRPPKNEGLVTPLVAVGLLWLLKFEFARARFYILNYLISMPSNAIS
jgi:hypothetical protein